MLTHDGICRGLCEVILNNSEYIIHYYNRRELDDILYSNQFNKFPIINTVSFINYFTNKLNNKCANKRNNLMQIKIFQTNFLLTIA